MRNPLREGLLKAVKEKKDELEDSRKIGLKIRETDLPWMAAGCEYRGLMCYGFSRGRKHVKRSDIIDPLDTLLMTGLKTVCPTARKIPGGLFKKRHKRKNTLGNPPVLLKYVGTCAEDNAANQILYAYKGRPGKPTSLKALTFDHPVRIRTFKRERMCVVCRTLFTES